MNDVEIVLIALDLVLKAQDAGIETLQFQVGLGSLEVPPDAVRIAMDLLSQTRMITTTHISAYQAARRSLGDA